MENQSDEILWSLYLKGDKDALEQIYRRYYPLLLNYGCRLSANQDLVQDCIQNLFIKLMSKSRNLSDTPSVKGYLLKAFRNNLLDSLEKEEKHNDFIFIDEIPEVYHTTTEEESALKEDISNLSLAYQDLSAKQKEILYLFYIKGISHKEIADILNINYQSSKNRLSQSLVQLRKIFFLNKK